MSTNAPDTRLDPSKRRLDEIFTAFRPRRWWFGHYHEYLQGRHKDCLWTLLSGSHTGSRWVETLPLLVNKVGRQACCDTGISK